MYVLRVVKGKAKKLNALRKAQSDPNRFPRATLDFKIKIFSFSIANCSNTTKKVKIANRSILCHW